MEIALDVSGHVASIIASTAGTNPRLCVACLTFDSGQSPTLSMRELIAFADAKRTALDDLAVLLHVYPLLVSEPSITLSYSGCPGHRRRAAATAAGTTVLST